MNSCPVCDEVSSESAYPAPLGRLIDCPRCGRYLLAGTLSAPADLLSATLTAAQRSVLSHRLRRMQRQHAQLIDIYQDDLSRLRLDDPLPNASEQVDQLIIWVGDNQLAPSEQLIAGTQAISAWIGARIARRGQCDGLVWLLQENEVKQYVRSGQIIQGKIPISLSLLGWDRYEKLKNQRISSKIAFMAMAFGDAELNHMLEAVFKPAVARAGFELRILTDGQPAGLIDDQLRVALRASRFVIADLTHSNNGAYWEAGFAEGLGRPVIYTCRESEWNKFDEKGKKIIHFDTNHMVTIIWKAGDQHQVGARLTATIRATLPTEARLTDN